VNPGGTGGCFSSIQAALDARAGNDDVIQVSAGTYSESLTTRRYNAHIEGAGVDATIIEARAGAEETFIGCGIWTFQTGEVRLAGLTIRPAPPA
jgi:pectin methylesterase-like acyl-CoA thioesterase